MASAKSSRSRPAGHSGVFPVNAAAGSGGGDGGVQLADKLKIFKTDNFDPDAYVQSKCRSMDEKVVRPPTIFVPACLRDHVVRLFEVYRAIAQSELNYNLVPLEVGEEYKLRTGLKVRAFRTCHVIPSQGYVIYSVKKQLKQEFIGLPGSEIKQLRLSDHEHGIHIAFKGDTTSDFLDPDNADVLRTKILVVESTFLDDESHSVEHARKYGHTHLSEIASQSDKLGNKAILLFHFSARYTTEEIDAAINRLPPSFRSRVCACALKEGFE